MIYLTTMSVLLSTNAGTKWNYTSKNGFTCVKSDGLSIAILDMFLSGLFSSDPTLPHRVNSYQLNNILEKDLVLGFQISNTNRILGFDTHYSILKKIMMQLESFPDIYGTEISRPGNMMDYLLLKSHDTIDVVDLWDIVSRTFGSMTDSINDIHYCDGIKSSVSFNKTLQWLCYSLIEPMRLYGFNIVNLEILTGLPEHRNGALLIDTGVLILKNQSDYEKSYDIVHN